MQRFGEICAAIKLNRLDGSSEHLMKLRCVAGGDSDVQIVPSARTLRDAAEEARVPRGTHHELLRGDRAVVRTRNSTGPRGDVQKRYENEKGNWGKTWRIYGIIQLKEKKE